MIFYSSKMALNSVKISGDATTTSDAITFYRTMLYTLELVGSNSSNGIVNVIGSLNNEEGVVSLMPSLNHKKGYTYIYGNKIKLNGDVEINETPIDKIYKQKVFTLLIDLLANQNQTISYPLKTTNKLTIHSSSPGILTFNNEKYTFNSNTEIVNLPKEIPLDNVEITSDVDCRVLISVYQI